MPFARARDGTRLRYDVAGGDLNAPAALLVMGLALRGEAWGETRDRLASAGYRTITMDNRGAGESPVPSFKYSIARMAEDAVAVMHEAFVRRTHVVGLSLGGMIAQELALLHPGRVGALVLQSTTAGRPWPRYVAPTVGLRWAAVLRALVARDAERRDRTLLRVVTTGPFAERADLSDPRVRAVLEAFQERISVDGFFGQLIAAAPYGAWRRLAGIAAPTLIQHGTKDGFLRPSAARAMAARIPGARLSVYEGAGHALALQHPESIAELVAFLREHDSVLAASR